MRAAGGHRRHWIAAGLTAGALGLFAAAGMLARHSAPPSMYEREPVAAASPLPPPAPDTSMAAEAGFVLDALRSATPSEPASSEPPPWRPTPLRRPAAPADPDPQEGRDATPARPDRAAAPVSRSRPVRRVEQERARPVRVTIPAIGVDAPVIPLHLNTDRTLQVPQDFAVTGWFADGPEPGERGPSVVVGHVDSRSGPAVFYRLRALRRGDVIAFALADGSTVRFAVESALAAPKDRFPTNLVYGRTPGPTLRLVTCDGTFDRATGHYLDNYIVLASIVAGS